MRLIFAGYDLQRLANGHDFWVRLVFVDIRLSSLDPCWYTL